MKRRSRRAPVIDARMQAMKIRFTAVGQKTDGPIKLMYRNAAAIELSSLLKRKNNKNNAKLATLQVGGGSFYVESWSYIFCFISPLNAEMPLYALRVS